MTKHVVLIVLVARVIHANAAPLIPPELVGEWVLESSDFDRVVRAGGLAIQAIYITAHGAGIGVSAPTTIGVKLTVVYDAAARILTVSVGREKPCDLRYDATLKTLKVVKAEFCEEFTFVRGRKQNPDHILEMLK